MALTALQIQARIDALQKARDTGVQRIRHGETITEWRTLAEVNQIIADLKAQLAGVQETPRARVNYIQQDSRGYGD